MTVNLQLKLINCRNNIGCNMSKKFKLQQLKCLLMLLVFIFAIKSYSKMCTLKYIFPQILCSYVGVLGLGPVL